MVLVRADWVFLLFWFVLGLWDSLLKSLFLTVFEMVNGNERGYDMGIICILTVE